MTLARFIAEIVNAQDKAGNTALNLAALTGTKSIIDQLLEVGADPHVGNLGGLAPVDSVRRHVREAGDAILCADRWRLKTELSWRFPAIAHLCSISLPLSLLSEMQSSAHMIGGQSYYSS